MFLDVLERKHWGRGRLPISHWEVLGGVEGVWGGFWGYFAIFFFELDAEMSLPPTPAWPLCSLLLFSSPSPRVSQLLPSPPPCPPCRHFPFPACSGVWEAPSNPLRFLLAFFNPPKSPVPFLTQGREGAAGTSRIVELLLPPLAGIRLDRSFPGICRSGSAKLLGRPRDGRGAEITPLSSPPPCPLTVPVSHPAWSPPGRSLY